jgi:hypothetical protein
VAMTQIPISSLERHKFECLNAYEQCRHSSILHGCVNRSAPGSHSSGHTIVISLDDATPRDLRDLPAYGYRVRRECARPSSQARSARCHWRRHDDRPRCQVSVPSNLGGGWARVDSVAQPERSCEAKDPRAILWRREAVLQRSRSCCPQFPRAELFCLAEGQDTGRAGVNSPLIMTTALAFGSSVWTVTKRHPGGGAIKRI